MGFKEADLEIAIKDLLVQEGYGYVPGDQIVRGEGEVLIESDLQDYLRSRYGSAGITENEIRTVVLQLKALPTGDLYKSNRKFCNWLAEGFPLKRENPTQKDLLIELVDYSTPEPGTKFEANIAESEISQAADTSVPYSADLNIFKFVNQFEIQGQEKRELKPVERLKMVMTRSKDDEKELYDLLGSKDDRKDLDRLFKQEKSNFKIAIVVDMWLTGFDVPCLDAIYIDKPIAEHSLIQTISRVNRTYEGKEKGIVVDYIGIRKKMNEALKQYSAGSAENIEDISTAVVEFRNHLDLLEKLMHGFHAEKYDTGTELEKLETLKRATEFVQRTKETETRFMNLSKRLKAAYDICVGSDQILEKERDEAHFYFAVRTILFKLTRENAPDASQMNDRVRSLVEEALNSDGVQEVLQIGASDAPAAQNIFDKDYLEHINRIRLPNTKIKLLQRLLKKAIDNLRKVNKIKGIDFSKKMRSLVELYNDRSEADVLKSEVYEEMAERLTDMILQVQKEFTAGDSLGISFEEKAFYDILKSLCAKYHFEYPDEKLLALSREVKKIVDAQAAYPDWDTREDIKSALKVDLILLLDRFGYPPVERDEVYSEIFDQAENFKKHRS